MQLVVWALLAVVCVARPPENWGPESGDILADSRLVVTFVENEPRMVLASPRHERHYDVEIPLVTFGDVKAHLTREGAVGFYSSYERVKSQTILVLEATHPDANTTLACLMPGSNEIWTRTGEPVVSMLTCDLHIRNQRLRQPTRITAEMYVSSRQHDRPTSVVHPRVGDNATRVNLVLQREDRQHVLRVQAESTSAVLPIVTPGAGSLSTVFAWNNATPAVGVRMSIDIHLSATTPNQVARDERVLLAILVGAVGVILSAYAAGVGVKRWLLSRDKAVRQAHNAATFAREGATARMVLSALGDAEMDRRAAASETREAAHIS